MAHHAMCEERWCFGIFIGKARLKESDRWLMMVIRVIV